MTELAILVKEQYTYNANTGEFKKVGDTAVKPLGITGLRVAGKKVSRTKLAWILYYGEEPAGPIKCKDGDKTNMKIDNLEPTLQNRRAVAKAEIAEMQELIAKGYSELEYKVITIVGRNKVKLEEIGYELPYGIAYEWLVKIDDLIAIGSNEVVKVKCSDCGDARETKAYRGKGKCKSCSKRGIKHTLEHRRNNSRAKRDESLTDAERVSRRSMPWMKAWAREVKEMANYTCECCGQIGGKLHSHHKDSYRSNTMRRADRLNGACLCEECHKDFHKQYGQGNNTVDQYEEWILNKLDEREVA